MRLDDLMGKDDAEIPAEVERELEVLDAALRGEEVPAGMEGIEALVSDLEAERPEPESRFEAELDAWAAAGFPRGRRPGTQVSGGTGRSSGGFFARFGSGGSRGWTPVAATAAVIVVAGVALTQVADFSSDDSTGGAPAVSGETDVADGGGAAAPEAVPGAPSEPQEQADESEGGLADMLEEAGTDDNLSNGSSEADGRLERKGTFQEDSIRGAIEPANRSGGANRGQETRRVERDAQLTLAAPADEVADVNDQVIDVVQGANGVVLNSRVSDTDDAARATLEVRVPSATLDETLAALSELANVQSRTEQAQDITRVYVGARDRLVGLRAERDNLASRIREADTDAEVAALQANLAQVNEAIADAKTELNEVETRAQLADVTIVITSEGPGASDDDDGWSFGDALDDAGKVLEVVAGVALISAAVLVPLAIIAAIAYFVVSAANRRAREKALGE